VAESFNQTDNFGFIFSVFYTTRKLDGFKFIKKKKLLSFILLAIEMFTNIFPGNVRYREAILFIRNQKFVVSNFSAVI
jgi:hypothetical protein